MQLLVCLLKRPLQCEVGLMTETMGVRNQASGQGCDQSKPFSRRLQEDNKKGFRTCCLAAHLVNFRESSCRSGLPLGAAGPAELPMEEVQAVTEAMEEPGKPDMRLFPLIPLDAVAMTGTHWLERARVELRVLVHVAATSGNRHPSGDSVCSAQLACKQLNRNDLNHLNHHYHSHADLGHA